MCVHLNICVIYLHIYKCIFIYPFMNTFIFIFIGYLQMQLELDDSSPTGPLLLRFVERNRVLLNMVLRHNVHLLESSFSALVTVPRCRHLLHFDIKRAFFKMKLKRMRQSSARSMHGSLRISVRRQNVFDDSFRSFIFYSY
jgi:hypothetical protein